MKLNIFKKKNKKKKDNFYESIEIVDRFIGEFLIEINKLSDEEFFE